MTSRPSVALAFLYLKFSLSLVKDNRAVLVL
jgi:hypothetical protein